jgi:NAD(P)-dependent dehydrogenase (short-subunit alcohol dehydrogenase family)
VKKFVITGGTDGIGKALARTFLERGDEVAIVGRNAEKGAAFLATAAELGAAGRAHFLLADLSLVSDTRKTIDELRSRFRKIDTLILGARHYRSRRVVTAEGFEHSFALYYLSRFLLSHELTGLLDAAEDPLILNLCGPGAGAGKIHWNDLGLERNYDGSTTLVQGGALNDLLGAGFARHRKSAKVRYVLFHPGVVSTGFSGQYDPDVAARIEYMRKTAKPVGKAIVPILAVLDNPPSEPVSAFMMGDPVSLDGPAFDVRSAERLHTETEKLLNHKESVSPGN